ERLDYLLADDSMEIIQSPSVFSFSLDAVLLAHFTYVPIKRGRILDLCTGNGVIPLLLSRRSHAHISGIEIQQRFVDMARRNVQLNQLEEQITMLPGDVIYRQPTLGHSSIAVVTCTPPYLPTPAS